MADGKYMNPAQNAIGVVSGMANLYQIGSEIAAKRRQMGQADRQMDQDDRRLGLMRITEARALRAQKFEETFSEKTFTEKKHQDDQRFELMETTEARASEEHEFNKTFSEDTLKEEERQWNEGEASRIAEVKRFNAGTDDIIYNINLSKKAIRLQENKRKAEMEIFELDKTRVDDVKVIKAKVRGGEALNDIDNKKLHDAVARFGNDDYAKLREYYSFDTAQQDAMDAYRAKERKRLRRIWEADKVKDPTSRSPNREETLNAANNFDKKNPWYARKLTLRDNGRTALETNKFAKLTANDRYTDLMKSLSAEWREYVNTNVNLFNAEGITEGQFKYKLRNLPREMLSNSNNDEDSKYLTRNFVLSSEKPIDTLFGILSKKDSVVGFNLEPEKSTKFLGVIETNKGIKSSIDKFNTSKQTEIDEINAKYEADKIEVLNKLSAGEINSIKNANSTTSYVSNPDSRIGKVKKTEALKAGEAAKVTAFNNNALRFLKSILFNLNSNP